MIPLPLSIIVSWINSKTILSVGILFQMSLIIFPNLVFLNLLLGLPSLKKLHLVIILNFLSMLFYRNYRTLLGIQYCLQRIPLKSFFTFYNKLNNQKRVSKSHKNWKWVSLLWRQRKIQTLDFSHISKRNYYRTYFELNINNIRRLGKV